MKFIAFLLGWLLRRTKERPNTWGNWTGAIVIIVPVLVGIGLGLNYSLDRASGWKHTHAVMIKAGIKPADREKHESQAKDVVRVTVDGRPQARHFNLSWWLREGAKASAWTKGDEATVSDPTRFWIIAKRPLSWALLGVATATLIYGILAFLEGRIAKYDVRRERERFERKEADKVAPESVAALVSLCKEYGDCKITIEEAMKYGPCRGGVMHFMETTFPGQTYMTLGELAPLLEQSRAWVSLCQVTTGKLKDLGVIKRDYDFRAVLKRPTEEVKVSKPKTAVHRTTPT